MGWVALVFPSCTAQVDDPTISGAGGTEAQAGTSGEGGTKDNLSGQDAMGGAAPSGGAGGMGTNPAGGSGGTSRNGGAAGMGAMGGISSVPVGDAVVPMFVAIGKMSRTTLSCDDGRTWIRNKSSDDNARCWQTGGPECDHHEGSGTGLAHGNGVFVANFGWGTPGKRWRSENGIDWVPVPGITETLGGLTFGNGVFVGGAGRPPLSRDGLTWTRGAEVDFGTNIRRIGFTGEGGGRFIMLGDGGGRTNLMVSSNNGMTFTRPAGLPATCGTSPMGVAYGGGVTVAAGSQGDICYSRDGGQTWAAKKLPTGIRNIVWHVDKFLAYDIDRGYRSTDGEAWIQFKTQPERIGLASLASSPTGTLVSVFDEWGQYYDKQIFYRSTDGVTWQALPRGAFVGSHPITAITWGYGRPSADCPAP